MFIIESLDSINLRQLAITIAIASHESKPESIQYSLIYDPSGGHLKQRHHAAQCDVETGVIRGQYDSGEDFVVFGGS